MSVISGRSAELESVPDKEGVSLSDHVPSGATDQRLTLTVPADGTVEQVSIRIYTGAQLDLQVEPVVVDEQNATRPLVELVGKEYIDGDDDYHKWDLSRAVEGGETIEFRATNNDGSNAYDYRVNLEIDYAGGFERLLGGLL